jgi:hypothetical protein
MLVVIESPWAGLGAGERAKKYLRNCIRDSLARNELPWASHGMLAWTEALYESDPEQRAEGINVNKRMILRADLIAVYLDHGVSKGMQTAITWARMHGKKVESRRLFV